MRLIQEKINLHIWSTDV